MTKRARQTFWALTALAVVASGALSSGLAAPPSPVAGLAVAVSAPVLAAASLLAVRILVVLGRRGP